jgi:hypothetical protein
VLNACGAFSPTSRTMVGVSCPPSPPSRDLRERGAQALALAARRRSLERSLLLPVDARRDRGRHQQRARAGGRESESSARFLALYAGPLVARSPSSRP